jgi:hypothetical protein
MHCSNMFHGSGESPIRPDASAAVTEALTIGWRRLGDEHARAHADRGGAFGVVRSMEQAASGRCRRTCAARCMRFPGLSVDRQRRVGGDEMLGTHFVPEVVGDHGIQRRVVFCDAFRLAGPRDHRGRGRVSKRELQRCCLDGHEYQHSGKPCSSTTSGPSPASATRIDAPLTSPTLHRMSMPAPERSASAGAS